MAISFTGRCKMKLDFVNLATKGKLRNQINDNVPYLFFMEKKGTIDFSFN
jgi:hypothetical protein